MLPVPGKSSEKCGWTTISFLRGPLIKTLQLVVFRSEQSGVCRFQDGLARVAVLPQLKVDQLCSVVDGTADFDPKRISTHRSWIIVCDGQQQNGRAVLLSSTGWGQSAPESNKLRNKTRVRES
jgi:hypothetical protein